MNYELTHNHFERCGIPSKMRGGLARYIFHGVRPGSFLLAVLENDFAKAVLQADAQNQKILRSYPVFLHNYAPSECHGSPEVVAQWVTHQGLSGLNDVIFMAEDPSWTTRETTGENKHREQGKT